MTDMGAAFEEIGAAAFEEAEEEVLRRVAELARETGSVTQAVDLYATAEWGADISQTEWAKETDRERTSISKSVTRAREAVSGD